MNLILRLIGVIAAALLGRRVDFLGESRVRFRVWPTDLDLNIHMTNARYLSVMDLGRVDLLLRSGVARLMLRNRWQAVLGATTIRYRRPLKPFRSFNVTTRVLCWDEKWIYLEQRIESDGRLAAVAVMQGIFRDTDGTVPPSRILAELGEERASPEFPASVAALSAAEMPV